MDHSTTSTSRRSFLRTTGAAGATLAAGTALAGGALPGVASAADVSTTTLPTVKLGNFTYPDLTKRPTSGDLLLASFVNSLARATVQIYDDVINAKTAEANNAVLSSLRENHRAHAGSLAALAGTGGASVANRTLVREYTSQVASTPMPSLYKLEQVLLATHFEILGKMVGTDPAGIVGSMLPTLSRHLVVLGELQSASLTSYMPNFDDAKGALNPDAYPVERV
ncbi:MAG: hypothetical protein JWL70_856 [Acidimicrobiia bacterium]|nr:hypothetical protein [Acidimicrobiia bacterium]